MGWSVVLGGVLALFGGFGGALLIRWLDGRRADAQRLDDLAARIHVVLSELAANASNLKLRIDRADWMGRFEAVDRGYRESELALARALSLKAQLALFRAYEPLRSPTWLYNVLNVDTSVSTSKRFEIDAAKASELRDLLDQAATQLRVERDKLGKKYQLDPSEVKDL